MYKNINDFLSKFQNIKNQTHEVANEIIEILKNAGVGGIQQNDISVNKEILKLKISQTKKAEVFLKKEKILKEFSLNPKTKNIKQIS